MSGDTSYCNNNLASIYTPLLHNFWYVAGLANEFTTDLRERTILNRSLVMYRDEEGSPIILQNRCAHRSFPLDQSTLEEGGIRCKYHGIKYNHKGEITDVPCQSKCPNQAIQSYPAKEISPFVWIWMGDPENADESDIPDIDVHETDKWTHVVSDYNYVEGNYVLMHENICDLSHLPYLHSETFKTPAGYSSIAVHTEVCGDIVKYHRTMTDWSTLSSFFHPAIDYSNKAFIYTSAGSYVSPAVNIGHAELKDMDENSEQSIKHYINHYMTPETQHTCHYYWFYARNYEIEDVAYSEKFGEMVQKGFDEDRIAVKNMQSILENDEHKFREISVKADAPGLAMRKTLKRQADMEN